MGDGYRRVAKVPKGEAAHRWLRVSLAVQRSVDVRLWKNGQEKSMLKAGMRTSTFMDAECGLGD